MIFALTFGMIALLLTGLPVAMALGLSALGALLIGGGAFQPSILSTKMQFGLQNFVLVGIPLFILAAKLMNTAGITEKIFRFAGALVGFLPGGMGHSNVLAGLIFSGMSGSAVVDAASLGQIELDAMDKAGYPRNFSVAITAGSSIIGPIFPPSIPMIIFSFASGVSVGRLFLGGVVPGLLMTIALMVMVTVYAQKVKMPRDPFPTWARVSKTFVDAFLPILTPVILLACIWSGVVTPTEAAGVAVCYALLIGVFALHELSPKALVTVFVETARESAVVGFVIAAASLFGWVLMRSGMTVQIAQTLLAASTNPLIILLLINLALLVVGCFLDPTVSILILAPIFLPVVTAVGIDPVHFGLVMVLNLMIGLLTPPFGGVLFVMVQITGMKFEDVVKATMPVLIPLLVVLVLLTLFPSLVTGLPDLLMGVAK
jgi:tripartite ATP-independent transporter DctM subunit